MCAFPIRQPMGGPEGRAGQAGTPGSTVLSGGHPLQRTFHGAMECRFHRGFSPTSQSLSVFLSVSVCLETPPDALILESPFTNIREEAKSHPFSAASLGFIKN